MQREQLSLLYALCNHLASLPFSDHRNLSDGYSTGRAERSSSVAQRGGRHGYRRVHAHSHPGELVDYLGMGLKVLRPGVADDIKMGTFPSVGEMLRQTMEMDIPVYVCEASKQMLGWDDVELIDGAKIVGAGTLNDLALDSGANMWF